MTFAGYFALVVCTFGLAIFLFPIWFIMYITYQVGSLFGYYQPEPEPAPAPTAVEAPLFKDDHTIPADGGMKTIGQTGPQKRVDKNKTIDTLGE